MTDHIEDIVEFVQVLVDKGFAYESQGDVYYRTQKFEGYGKLSHQSTDELKVGARIEEGDKKENATRLCSLESGERRRNFMGKSMGCRTSWLAYRMFGNGDANILGIRLISMRAGKI